VFVLPPFRSPPMSRMSVQTDQSVLKLNIPESSSGVELVGNENQRTSYLTTVELESVNASLSLSSFSNLNASSSVFSTNVMITAPQQITLSSYSCKAESECLVQVNLRQLNPSVKMIESIGMRV